jgi:predicted O-methyltransferase YrrM
MRRIGHWTPRYVLARLAEIHYHISYPNHPWLTKQANAILATFLKTSDIGLEFGSGRSTVWLAQRIKHLTSVEHNAEWFARVGRMLREHDVPNVDYRCHPKSDNDEHPRVSQYVRVIDDFESDSIDFVLIDGIYREYCAIRVLDKICPGGLLVIDNVNRYLPSDTHSPRSRSIDAGPLNDIWSDVEKSIASWRHIWTSSGVTDTAFFFKPCSY